MGLIAKHPLQVSFDFILVKASVLKGPNCKILRVKISIIGLCPKVEWVERVSIIGLYPKVEWVEKISIVSLYSSIGG